MSWIKHPDGWLHRPWWKVAANTVLRALQCGRRYRWLITTEVDFDSLIAGQPKVTGYGFSRVEIKNAP
jgi:hypothetical protein